jgi:hypothetical protein
LNAHTSARFPIDQQHDIATLPDAYSHHNTLICTTIDSQSVQGSLDGPTLDATANLAYLDVFSDAFALF